MSTFLFENGLLLTVCSLDWFFDFAYRFYYKVFFILSNALDLFEMLWYYIIVGQKVFCRPIYSLRAKGVFL